MLFTFWSFWVFVPVLLLDSEEPRNDNFSEGILAGWTGQGMVRYPFIYFFSQTNDFRRCCLSVHPICLFILQSNPVHTITEAFISVKHVFHKFCWFYCLWMLILSFWVSFCNSNYFLQRLNLILQPTFTFFFFRYL